MITQQEQNKIIKVLGKHYTGKIIPVLDKKGIANADGNSFSAVSIRKIVTRKYENLPVELEILKLVAKTEKATKKALQARKTLIVKK